MPNYWVVGAMYSGQDDQTEKFIRRGYWRLGWDDNQQPAMALKRDDIQPGDRIAIKSMLGKGSSNIRIKAIGVVKEIDPEDRRIYVNWAAVDLNREVPSRGCFGSIHGPFLSSDVWVSEVFHI